jgi:hypothetical protein
LKDEEDMIINQPAKADYSNNVPSLTLSCFFYSHIHGKGDFSFIKERKKKEKFLPLSLFYNFFRAGQRFSPVL